LSEGSAVRGISAVTLGTHNMAEAVRFYRELGFSLVHGGPKAAFTSFAVGVSYLNLIAVQASQTWGWWGRVIIHVDDVDAFYQRAMARGLRPQAPPANAPWGERFFHLADPDGHELSLARPLG